MAGADAEAALELNRANDVRGMKLTYTQLLNAAVECDLTVARLAHDQFYIVTGTGFATHDFQWIQSQLPQGMDVTLTDRTSYSVLSLMGPRARAILSQVTTDDVSNEAFPFGQTRLLRCGAFDVQALRVTYVGELGWELHVAVEHAGELFDRLHAAGAAHGLVNAGYRAIETLRLEGVRLG